MKPGVLDPQEGSDLPGLGGLAHTGYTLPSRHVPTASAGRALLLIAAFLAVYALFDVLPIVLPKQDVVEGLRWGDLIDVPLVFLLVGAYVLLGLEAGLWRTTLLKLASAFSLVVLVQGHGIHMAANTISAYLDTSSSAWRPAYFLDERWGHAEIHTGLILQALLFIAASRPTAGPARLSSAAKPVLLSLATVYGLFLTADAIEGQSVALMLPAGVVLASIGFAKRGDSSLYRIFFASAFAVAVLALAAYWLWHGGFPEHDWHVWQELPLGL